MRHPSLPSISKQTSGHTPIDRAYAILGDDLSAAMRESLLSEAQSLAERTGDDVLRAAASFGMAELDVVQGEVVTAASRLRDSVRVLNDIDTSLVEQIGRVRFVDVVEPMTRRALRTAVAVGDATSGLHLVEVRRSGRLAGLLRQRGRVPIDADAAALLACIEHQREWEGGILPGVRGGGVSGERQPPTARGTMLRPRQPTSSARLISGRSWPNSPPRHSPRSTAPCRSTSASCSAVCPTMWTYCWWTSSTRPSNKTSW